MSKRCAMHDPHGPKAAVGSQGSVSSLQVSEGTACELYDCFVNGSVKLARSASAKLVRTHVFAAWLGI